MPVLEPNPTGGQRKMLLMFGLIFAIMGVVAIIAEIASKMG
jgi:hypothetical protein